MRQIALCLAGLLTACATSDAPAPETEPEDIPTEAARATDHDGTQVVQIYDVSDLVDPPGDVERVADLAIDVRTYVTFCLADSDPAAVVQTSGTSLVLRATPALHDRVARHLEMGREGLWNVR